MPEPAAPHGDLGGRGCTLGRGSVSGPAHVALTSSPNLSEPRLSLVRLRARHRLPRLLWRREVALGPGVALTQVPETPRRLCLELGHRGPRILLWS